MEKGEDIYHYISLVGSLTEVEFTQNSKDWYTGTVLGINLEEESVLIKNTSLTSAMPAYWYKLYFRLNLNHPKNFKVRIK